MLSQQAGGFDHPLRGGQAAEVVCRSTQQETVRYPVRVSECVEASKTAFEGAAAPELR